MGGRVASIEASSQRKADMALIEATKPCKTFSTGGGPSGAGTSTLLYALSGMDAPTLGRGE